MFDTITNELGKPVDVLPMSIATVLTSQNKGKLIEIKGFYGCPRRKLTINIYTGLIFKIEKHESNELYDVIYIGGYIRIEAEEYKKLIAEMS